MAVSKWYPKSERMVRFLVSDTTKIEVTQLVRAVSYIPQDRTMQVMICDMDVEPDGMDSFIQFMRPHIGPDRIVEWHLLTDGVGNNPRVFVGYRP